MAVFFDALLKWTLADLGQLQVEVPGGRNRRLERGGLTLLDETYNASPEAVLAALDVTAPGGNATWSNNFQWSTNAENNSSQEANQPGASSTVVGLLNEGSGTGYTFIYNSWGNWAPRAADDKLLLRSGSRIGDMWRQKK